MFKIEPIFNPNGANENLTEQLIKDLNNCVLNSQSADELTKNFTRYFIKGIVEGYEQQSEKKYTGFLPESVKKLL